MATQYDWLKDDAIKMEQQTGIPAPIIVAQAILESGAGLNSGLVRKGKNLFGIKGVGSAGSIWMPTREQDKNGNVRWENAQFKKYNTYAESMVDHAKLLQKPLYQAYLSNAKTLEDWIQGIHRSPYATDASYDDKLRNIINSNNLVELGTGKYSMGSYQDKIDNSIDPTTPGVTNTVNGGLATSEIMKPIYKYVLLLVLFIVGIFFLIQAIPVNEITNKATNTALETAGKVIKPVQAVNKVAKKITKK